MNARIDWSFELDSQVQKKNTSYADRVKGAGASVKK